MIYAHIWYKDPRISYRVVGKHLSRSSQYGNSPYLTGGSFIPRQLQNAEKGSWLRVENSRARHLISDGRRWAFYPDRERNSQVNYLQTIWVGYQLVDWGKCNDFRLSVIPYLNIQSLNSQTRVANFESILGEKIGVGQSLMIEGFCPFAEDGIRTNLRLQCQNAVMVQFKNDLCESLSHIGHNKWSRPCPTTTLPYTSGPCCLIASDPSISSGK